MQPIRLGFIGAGAMATFAVYPALQFAPIDLQAVCDIDEQKAKAVARKFGAGRWYTDYHQMWQAEDLEAVVVHMHPGPRHQIVLAALDAGYHVFIPKPPADTLARTVELSQAARRADKRVMVNFQRRFSFGVSRAKEIMSAPDFGQLTQLLFSFCSGKYDEGRGRWYHDHVHAFVLDFAVHHFDLARFLGGKIEELALYHRELDGGLSLAGALAFEGGAVGSLQLNSQRVWWRNYDRIEITGQGSYIVLDGLWQVRHYTATDNTFTENYSDQRSAELTGDAGSLVEFVRSIREEREPAASIHDSVETMKLYQAVYDAVREGRQGAIPLVA